MDDDPIKVTRGNLTDEELGALVAVLTELTLSLIHI